MLICFSTNCTMIRIISLTSLKITQAFRLLLDFAENQGVFLDFKFQNSIQITNGSDNGDSDNWGSTVHIFVLEHVCMILHTYVPTNTVLKVCWYTFWFEFTGNHDIIQGIKWLRLHQCCCNIPLYMYICICMHAHVYASVHMYDMYVFMCVSMYVYLLIFTYVHLLTHVNAYNIINSHNIRNYLPNTIIHTHLLAKSFACTNK